MTESGAKDKRRADVPRSEALTYQDAGVDRGRARALSAVFAALARKTRTEGAASELGGFAGLFALPTDVVEPLLVAGADGVGTKIEVARALDRWDTIGVDLVAMSVNDIVTTGARPLFFLDQLTMGRLDSAIAEAIVTGVAEGCRQAGVTLLGGETAEIPTLPSEAIELAGFAVGVVGRAALLGAHRVEEGDALLAIASSGIHANGLSLARRVLSLSDRATLETLLTPTRIYADAMRALAPLGPRVRAAAHITGGGLVENVPRVLPSTLVATIDLGTYERPKLFDEIAARGPVDEDELRATFNLGVGMVVVVAESAVHEAIARVTGAGERSFRLGRVDRRRQATAVRFTS